MIVASPVARKGVIVVEYLMLLTILVFGIVALLVTLRNAVSSELENVAQAVRALDQSYSFSGIESCQGYSAGSAYYSQNHQEYFEGGNSPAQQTQRSYGDNFPAVPQGGFRFEQRYQQSKQYFGQPIYRQYVPPINSPYYSPAPAD